MYGRGQFQLFPFFSDVCSGLACLAPQFGTRLKFPHSEMRKTRALAEIIPHNEMKNRIGWETGVVASLHIPFHSPPANWRGKAQ